MLGNTSLYIYLGTIIFGSMFFGLGLDYIFNINSIDAASLIHIEEDVGAIAILSSVLLWVSMLYFLIKPYFKKA